MSIRGNRSRGRCISATIAVVAAGLLLTGCGGDSEAKSPASTTSSPTSTTGSEAPSPTSTASVKVDDASLGTALSRIVYSGRAPAKGDGGACFVKALDATKFSAKGVRHVVELASDDWSAVTQSLRTQVSSADADIFGGQALRSAFDRCVDEALLGTKSPTATSSPTTKPLPPVPTPKTTPSKKAPNLTPRYEIPKGETISSSTQLEKGLVSIFVSFTKDAKQKQAYEKAGPCLADVTFKAGFTQNSLRFLAGGPPLGSGSVVEHLATSADKVLWDSPDFKSKLVDCTLSSPTPSK